MLLDRLQLYEYLVVSLIGSSRLNLPPTYPPTNI